MLALLKTKLAAVIISALAVTTVAGTTVAAANHAGPFAPGNVFGTSQNGDISRDSTTTPGSNGKTQHYEAQGQIVSVTFAAETGTTTGTPPGVTTGTPLGTASGTLMFLPNGSSAAISVTFTLQTHVEVADKTHTTKGAAGLKAGLYANIVGLKQTDGTVLATTIQANANGNAHQGGSQPTPGPGNDHHAPTPNPGSGHHDPTPNPGNGGHKPTPIPTP